MIKSSGVGNSSSSCLSYQSIGKEGGSSIKKGGLQGAMALIDKIKEETNTVKY